MQEIRAHLDAIMSAKAAEKPYMVVEEIRLIPDTHDALNVVRDPCYRCGSIACYNAYKEPAKEFARAQFREQVGKPINDEYRKQCIASINQYLDDCKATHGRTAKAVIATRLCRHLIQQTAFMAAYDGFHKAVLKKMQELSAEGPIEDKGIDQQFRAAVEDLLFVVS
jgi:hypothetical protein